MKTALLSARKASRAYPFVAMLPTRTPNTSTACMAAQRMADRPVELKKPNRAKPVVEKSMDGNIKTSRNSGSLEFKVSPKYFDCSQES